VTFSCDVHKELRVIERKKVFFLIYFQARTKFSGLKRTTFTSVKSLFAFDLLVLSSLIWTIHVLIHATQTIEFHCRKNKAKFFCKKIYLNRPKHKLLFYGALSTGIATSRQAAPLVDYLFIKKKMLESPSQANSLKLTLNYSDSVFARLRAMRVVTKTKECWNPNDKKRRRKD